MLWLCQSDTNGQDGVLKATAPPTSFFYEKAILQNIVFGGATLRNVQQFETYQQGPVAIHNSSEL